MKSLNLVNVEQKNALLEMQVPQPKPSKDEILIKVRAAGVTSAELSWYPATHTQAGAERQGGVPSHEFSGEIADLGESVQGFAIGQNVYGMNDWFANGALAEYCLTQPGSIAAKPERLTHSEAASVPISALSAWQGLFVRAKLRAGERLLVHGGAGAVGTFVIQLARLHGAYVIATASERNLNFVKELGANEVFDYKALNFQDQLSNIDVVFDAVGGDTLQNSWSLLSRSGRAVTIAANAETTSDERIKQAFFIVEPNHQQLVEIANLLNAGDVRAIVDTVLPWSKAADAYMGKVERTGRGKLVVAIE